MSEEVWNWQTDEKAGTLSDPTTVSGAEAVNPHVPGMTSIIIAVYNVNYPLLHLTGNCIGSVKEHTDKQTTPYEIILVDNGSPIRLGKPSDYNVDKFIQNEKNLGVSHAWNQGIRVSSGDFICLLNNDAMVFDHWLEDLLESLKHIDLVMATPMYGEPFSRAVESKKKRSEWLEKPITDSFSDFRDFSCVLTPKDVFNALGLFDERFFAYGEDLDFFKRMDEAGLKYASTKRVNTFHIINGTASNMPEIARVMDESREKLKDKYDLSIKEEVVVEKAEESKAPEVWGEDIKSDSSSEVVYTLENLPVLIRTQETGDKVFLVKDKKSYWITSAEALAEIGYGFGDVVTIPKELFYQIEMGERITLENVANFKHERA